MLRDSAHEEAPANQVPIPVGPNEQDVAVPEQMFLADDAFRVDLLKLIERRPDVILKVAHANDLNACPEV
jgi:hypothetical protein